MLHNVSIRRLLIALLFLVDSSVVVSQVHIKERVEISPKPPPQTAKTEEAAVFAEDPGPGGQTSVLVVHPCTVTATATIDIEHDNGYPNSDLYVKTLVGGSIAWFNGHNVSSPQPGNTTITFSLACGSIPIRLESTWEGIDITNITRTITSSSATFVITGMLSGHAYTVTALLQGLYDNSYDLATMDLTADATELTQCATRTTVHFRARNYKGDTYNGYSCSGPVVHKVWVESPRNVRLNYQGNWMKEVVYAWGYGDIAMQWSYGGETDNSTVTFKWQIGDRTETKVVDLIIAPTKLKLTYSNDNIGFGDSTIIQANVLNQDGTLSPIPEGWLVWFETNLSGDKGFLYLPDSTDFGDWIVSTSPTVKFYAMPQPNPPDSMIVPIGVMIIKDNGGSPGSIRGLKNRDSILASRPMLKSILGSKVMSPSSGTRSSLFNVTPTLAAVEPCNNIYTRDTLVVRKKQEVDHFVMTSVPDTIEHGKESIISIQAKNRDSMNLELSSGALTHFFLDTVGEKHGSLVKGNKKGSTLIDILYSDSKSGTVKYVADGDNPIGKPPQTVSIGTVLKADATKRGLGYVAVKCAMDTLTSYKQSDSSWADLTYDHYIRSMDTTRNGKTIVKIDTVYWNVRQKGCALTVLAMMLKYWGIEETPGTLVKKMTPKYIDTLGPINWLFSETYSRLKFIRADGRFPPTVKDSTNKRKTLKAKGGKDSLDFSKGQPLPLDTLKYFTSRCIPVGVYVVNPDRNTNHFVLVTGKDGDDYSIQDPGANRTLLSRYKNPYGTVYGLRYIIKQ